MRHATLLLTLLSAVSSWGSEAPRAERRAPDLDALLQAPPERPFTVASLPPGLRSRVELGRVSATEPRLGVPSFFWAPRERSPQDLRAIGLSPEQAARRALFEYAGLWRLDGARAAGEATIRVHDLGTGPVIATVALFEDGIEVFRDELRVVMDQRLGLVALSGWLSPNRARNGDFLLAEGTAITTAFFDLVGSPPSRDPKLTERFGGPYRTYAVSGLPDVRIKKVYFPLPDGLEPAFYLELDVKDRDRVSARYFSYVVSARDGRLLLRHDLARHDAFGYRVWADSSGAHLPFDGPQGNGPTPHPTGLPDQYSPPFVAPELVTLAHGPISTGDPWLEPGATQSQGNNAFAYADVASPDGFGAGDLAATPSAPGTFDRTYDVMQSADFSPDQRMASVTQLFYNVNFLHDWYYDLGFDEKAGNAQTNNLGRGGLGGDVLFAEAQDYSGTDNSNMQTPA
ncbi:MAG: M36 family metallopeptidase, partial [Myxococcaceae bacterium]